MNVDQVVGLYPYIEDLIGSDSVFALGGYSALVKQGILKEDRDTKDIDLCIFCGKQSFLLPEDISDNAIRNTTKWNSFYGGYVEELKNVKFFIDYKRKSASMQDDDYSMEAQRERLKSLLGVDKAACIELKRNIINAKTIKDEEKKKNNAAKKRGEEIRNAYLTSEQSNPFDIDEESRIDNFGYNSTRRYLSFGAYNLTQSYGTSADGIGRLTNMNRNGYATLIIYSSNMRIASICTRYGDFRTVTEIDIVTIPDSMTFNEYIENEVIVNEARVSVLREQREIGNNSLVNPPDPQPTITITGNTPYRQWSDIRSNYTITSPTYFYGTYGRDVVSPEPKIDYTPIWEELRTTYRPIAPLVFNKFFDDCKCDKLEFDLFFMSFDKLDKNTVIIDGVRYVHYYTVLKAKYEYCLNKMTNKEGFDKHIKDLEESFKSKHIYGLNSPADIEYLINKRDETK